jgi:hypothetical protein
MPTPAQLALRKGFAAISAALPGGLFYDDLPVQGTVDYVTLDDTSDGAKVPRLKERKAAMIRVLATVSPEVGKTFTDSNETTFRIRTVRRAGEWVDCECEVSG